MQPGCGTLPTVKNPRRRKPDDPERTETLRLPDGRTLWLRPVQPADAAPMAGAFSLLTEDEVRRRYLHPVKALSEKYLGALVNPVPGRDFVVVAAERLPPGEALVGAVARLDRDPCGDTAEFAILVSHFLAGQGLGKAMMRRLVEWAEAHGIRQLWGDVLDDNTSMIALSQAIGFRREHIPGSGGQVRVWLDLKPGM